MSMMVFTYPRDIFANCSPNRSLAMFAMLSSRRLGERALQIVNSAYIRSAVLLIWVPVQCQMSCGWRRWDTYLVVLVTSGVVLPHSYYEVEYRHK
jgi:hypothetical protein